LPIEISIGNISHLPNFKIRKIFFNSYKFENENVSDRQQKFSSRKV